MTRSDLLEHLQPAIDELVDRIEALLPDLVRAELLATLGKLTGEAAPTPKKQRVVHRDIKPAKSTKRAKTGPSCGKCGKSGHNARTCGKANAGDSLPEALDRQMDVRPKSASSSPPPARRPTASAPSKRQLARDEASNDGELVPLHKVVSFGL